MPPAAANNGGNSSHKTQPESSITLNSTDQRATKLCHLVKRPDYDGYGFNLHTEKSKPGQYIGKVDADSPAEIAGLREGNRILEVNGMPVNNEAHKHVVQRIKAIAWEVKLLVCTDEFRIMSSEKTITSADYKELSSNDGTNHNEINSENENGTLSLNSIKEVTTSESLPDIKNYVIPQLKNENNASNIEMMSDQKVAVTIPSINMTTQPPPPFVTTKLNSKTENDLVGSNLNPASPLHLPSTAAEMRAILQSKKKFNAKSNEVNLQEKYDIIQKL